MATTDLFKPEIVYLHGNTVVPAKDLSWKKDEITGEVLEKVKPNTHKFEHSLKSDLEKELQGVEAFPTKKEVLVTINYGFHSEREYKNCDLDNRAKTILDALKGPVYFDDSQVKILLTYKEFLKKSQESYYRFSVKILSEDVIIEVVNFIKHCQKVDN